MKVIYKTDRKNYNHRNLKLNRKYEAYKRQKIRKMRYELNKKYLEILSENRICNSNKGNEIRKKLGNKIYIYQLNFNPKEE